MEQGGVVSRRDTIQGRQMLASVALLALVCAVPAFADLSGLWGITYQAEWWTPSVEAVNEGTILLTQNGTSLEGRTSLGDRTDGLVDGSCRGDSFDMALRYSAEKPSVVIMLRGDLDNGTLQGRFSAMSSDGKTSRGKFTARPLIEASGAAPLWEERRGVGDVGNCTECIDRYITYGSPTPTTYFDPEAFFKEQEGKTMGDRPTYEVNYSEDTVLMVRGKPFIWNWWL